MSKICFMKGELFMYKKILFLTIVLMMSFIMPAMASKTTIPIIIDGKEIRSDVSPILVQNRTMVPVRVIAENIGALVTWQNPNVIIRKNQSELKLTLNSKIAYKNGNKLSDLDVVPFLKDNRTMLPLRFVAEALNLDVEYKNGKVFVDSVKMVDLTEKDIIYRDESIVFAVKDSIPYITSKWIFESSGMTEAFADTIYVTQKQQLGDTIYFNYLLPGTTSATLLYAFEKGKTVRPIYSPSSVYFEVKGSTLYGVANVSADINDIRVNAPPYTGNIYKVDLSKSYEEQTIEWIGKEGFLYGYELLFWDSGIVERTKDSISTPVIEVRDDGIYALGAELFSTNARDTYGFYKISLNGRSHEKVKK